MEISLWGRRWRRRQWGGKWTHRPMIEQVTATNHQSQPQPKTQTQTQTHTKTEPPQATGCATASGIASLRPTRPTVQVSERSICVWEDGAERGRLNGCLHVRFANRSLASPCRPSQRAAGAGCPAASTAAHAHASVHAHVAAQVDLHFLVCSCSHHVVAVCHTSTCPDRHCP